MSSNNAPTLDPHHLELWQNSARRGYKERGTEVGPAPLMARRLPPLTSIAPTRSERQVEIAALCPLKHDRIPTLSAAFASRVAREATSFSALTEGAAGLSLCPNFPRHLEPLDLNRANAIHPPTGEALPEISTQAIDLSQTRVGISMPSSRVHVRAPHAQPS